MIAQARKAKRRRRPRALSNAVRLLESFLAEYAERSMKNLERPFIMEVMAFVKRHGGNPRPYR